MSTAIAVDAHGQAFAAFERGPEIYGGEHRGLPSPLALVIVEVEEQILFGLNRWRGLWELPGGTLDEGEPPRQAAHRELREETGVALPDVELRWAGLAAFNLVNPSRTELAAVFAATLEKRPSTKNSEELPRLGWFRIDVPPSTHAPLDLAVARTALGAQVDSQMRIGPPKGSLCPLFLVPRCPLRLASRSRRGCIHLRSAQAFSSRS